MTGQRKSVKILGAIELFRTRFHYRQETVFNASTYLAFLEQLAASYRRQGAILIQDNASYHIVEFGLALQKILNVEEASVSMM